MRIRQKIAQIRQGGGERNGERKAADTGPGEKDYRRKALARSRPRFSAETAVEAAKRSASTRRYLASLKGGKALVHAVDNAATEKDQEQAVAAIISLAKAGNLTAFRYLAQIVDGVKL